jgi:RimJ/RimL family protein N-acetyltransferase
VISNRGGSNIYPHAQSRRILAVTKPAQLPAQLVTERLILRRWLPSDRAPFAELNADARVMEFLPKPLSPAESDALADGIERHFEQHGFGLWVVEVVGIAPFIGFVGLSIPRFEAAFAPCVEIGWRVAAEHWGHGYATEAAVSCGRFAFEHLSLDEIVSFTVPENVRSRRVMERIGMVHDPADDFDHPALPGGHRLRRHVLYRLTADQFVSNRKQNCSGSGITASQIDDRRSR